MSNILDTNPVLQELLVDWDELTSNEYNPIRNAIRLNDPDSQSAVKFRNFYHKIDTEMNKIIKDKHRGFNDSIQMYNEIIFLYRKLDQTLKSVEDKVSRIKKSLDIDIDQLNEEQTILYERDGIYSVLMKIDYLLKKFLKFDEKLSENDFEFCTQVVIEILGFNEDSLDDQAGHSVYSDGQYEKTNSEGNSTLSCDVLDDIGAVKEMKHKIRKRRIKLLQIMFRDLLEKIFLIQKIENVYNLEDKQFNYRQVLRNIVRINGLLELDEYLYDNLKLTFYREINKIIEKSGNITNIFMQTIQMALKINMTISDMKNLLNLQDEESFYGKKFTKFKIFCEKGGENCMKILKDEINRLILEYTVKESSQKVDFDKDKLVDLVNYEALYENKYRISETFRNAQTHKILYGDYKLVRNPSIRHLFLFNEIIDEEIASLKKIIRKNLRAEHKPSFSIKDLTIETDKTRDTNRTLSNIEVGESSQGNNSFVRNDKTDVYFIKDHDNLSNVTVKGGVDRQQENDLKFLKEIKQFIELQINEQIKTKDQNLRIQIDHILQKKSRFSLNSRLSSLNIFDEFLNVLKPYKKRAIFLKNLPLVINQFEDHLRNSFSLFYKSEIIKLTIQERHKFPSTLECFKRQIIIKMNHIQDLSLQEEAVLKKSLLIAGIHTVEDYLMQKTTVDFRNERFHNLKQKFNELEEIYSTAFSLEIFLTILHFIDKFLRNFRTNLVEFYQTLQKIRNAHTLFNQNLPFLSELSSVLNYYILQNTHKLLLKSPTDLKLFIEQLLDIEAAIDSIGLPFTDGVDQALEFFNAVLENTTDDPKIKQMRVKIGL